MAAELGGSQLSSLLESVPGLASVLRSPVADAIVNITRAGAGLADLELSDVRELVQYAVRRGLIPSAEGTELLQEVEAAVGKGRRKPKVPVRGTAKKQTKKVVKTKAVKKTAKKTKTVKKNTKKKMPKGGRG